MHPHLTISKAKVLLPNNSSGATICRSVFSFHIHTISASRASADDLSVADADPVESDVAQWLKTLHGANVNKNGPVTGIA